MGSASRASAIRVKVVATEQVIMNPVLRGGGTAARGDKESNTGIVRNIRMLRKPIDPEAVWIYLVGVANRKA